MASLKLFANRLQHNFQFLDATFRQHNIRWGVVTKLLCGNPTFLSEVLKLSPVEVLDSRVSNLRTVRELDTTPQTVYIKPPPLGSVPDIVAYADVSFASDITIINALSAEAVAQGKVHKILIMIEMGDLREGVLGENLVEFYGQVFQLPGIEVVGLGTNLNCLHGVMPTQDKLIQLSLYRQIIELTFGRKIPWLSGGTSVTLPLLLQGRLPKAINHFRVGEALFFGLNLFTRKPIPEMNTRVFELEAEIIELTEKPFAPEGEMGISAVTGEQTQIDENLYGQTGLRGLLDIGLLDINPKYLLPLDEGVKVIGATSDILVVDLSKAKETFKTGQRLRFGLRYMGALALMNSDYVEKQVVYTPEPTPMGIPVAGLN